MYMALNIPKEYRKFFFRSLTLWSNTSRYVINSFQDQRCCIQGLYFMNLTLAKKMCFQYKNLIELINCKHTTYFISSCPISVSEDMKEFCNAV